MEPIDNQNDLNKKENTRGQSDKYVRHKLPYLNGKQVHASGPSMSSQNLANLETFLENEKNKSNGNEQQPWSKLDKTAKTKKFMTYAEIYKEEKQLSPEEYSKLVAFLKDCLDRKKLHRVKDVVYDKDTGLIKDIPALSHNKGTNHYTLKNLEKRVSTLKSLGPRKHTKTSLAEIVSTNAGEDDQDNSSSEEA